MTEERMIRVTKPDSIDGEVAIRLFFDYYRPDGFLGREGMNIDNMDELPLAPQKDWKPFCYNGHNGVCVGSLNILRMFHADLSEFELPPTCKKCPYL
jgi:hypothetical protein